MTYIIVKAKVGYIVHREAGRHEALSVEDFAAFDTWDQAAAWIGEQFQEQEVGNVSDR